MKNVIRIFFAVVIMVGGTLAFAHWAINSFDIAFSNFDKSNIVNVAMVKPSQNNSESGSVPNDLSATSVVAMTEDATVKQAVALDIKEGSFKFSFPKKETNLYEGCSYKVSWISLNTNSVDFSLTDAGTSEIIGPITGGVPKNITGENLDSFNWKVGSVWPGRYYIAVANINGVKADKKSSVFNIAKIPTEIEQKDIEDFCSKNI